MRGECKARISTRQEHDSFLTTSIERKYGGRTIGAELHRDPESFSPCLILFTGALDSMKKLVFCADGTWDDPDSNSNVCQLYNAVENIPGVQIPMYDSGVGSDGTPFDRWLGGGVGAGLFQKIRDGYTAIAAQYCPGDQIFLFGFSRGAYTARSLAGMIAICGLPTVMQSDSRCLDTAFEAYRNAAQRPALLEDLNAEYHMDDAKIQLLGVWDTVGSLGIPAMFGQIDTTQYGFLSTGLHQDVLNAVQALSIDEERLQFQPALWTGTPVPGQFISQVWFPGVHCDVGGGYAPDANGAKLANIPLLWMARHAKACGLQFRPGVLPVDTLGSDALATIHQSRTGAYRIFPAHVRNIAEDSCLASTVPGRCKDPGAKYSPANLHFLGGQLAASYTTDDVNPGEPPSNSENSG